MKPLSEVQGLSPHHLGDEVASALDDVGDLHVYDYDDVTARFVGEKN